MFKVKTLHDFYSIDDLNDLKTHLKNFRNRVQKNREYCHSFPIEHYDEVMNIGNELKALDRTDKAIDSLISEIDDTLKYMEKK